MASFGAWMLTTWQLFATHFKASVVDVGVGALFGITTDSFALAVFASLLFVALPFAKCFFVNLC